MDGTPSLTLTMIEQRRRGLGTALHGLATDLARERRRTAELERELAALRAELRPYGPLIDAEAGRTEPKAAPLGRASRATG